MNASPPSRIASVSALLAVVLATLASLMAALRWRLTAAERDFAWPWPQAAPDVTAVLVLVGVAAGLAAVLAWFGHRDPTWRRSLGESLVWPAAPLAVAWMVMPASGSPTIATGLAMVAAAVVAWRLDRRERGMAASGTGRSHPPLRARWVWLHGLIIAVLVALGLWGDGFNDLVAFGVSLALYPVYALCQLFLVLAVTWPRLSRLAGGRPAGPVAAVAVVFALVHWPNPVLMGLTGGGMVFWAAAYARGRGLVVLALSMGLLASLAAQGLPNDWTDHMRAGPRFVRMRAVPRIAAASDARTRPLVAGEARTKALLADLYPGIVGREADAGELQRWWQSIAACRRGVLAWQFFISEEYRRKFGEPAGEQSLPGDVHWTRLTAPWPERIGGYTLGPVAPWDEFVARLYREILQREAAAAELAAWSPGLSPRQQQRLVEVILDQRRDLAAAPFDTCTCERMMLHH